MAISIDEIADKTSVGQQAKFKSTLSSIAEAWDEVAELGLLDDGWQPPTEEPSGSANAQQTAQTAAKQTATEQTSEQTATEFHVQRREELCARLRAKIAELRPSSTMNDRAAPARKAARLARGGDGSGGDGDVADDPTCAHHAVANIGEEGRKAIDKILKAYMAITDEQAQSDATKVRIHPRRPLRLGERNRA
eukprot:6370906-Prymnesium_polylepis.1